MAETEGENLTVSGGAPGGSAPESSPTAPPSGGKAVRLVPVLVSLGVVGLVVAVFVLGKSLGIVAEEPSPTPVPEETVGRASLSPAPAHGSPAPRVVPDQLPPLSSGSSMKEIEKDINSTPIESFDADFADLRNDASGL